MTYITPDDVALQQEAKRYAARHPMPLIPGFIGNGLLSNGRSFPLLSAQPLPPYQPKLMITKPVTGPVPPPHATTWSPLEQDYVDPPGPGMFLPLQGLGATVTNDVVMGMSATTAGVLLGLMAWWMLRSRR